MVIFLVIGVSLIALGGASLAMYLTGRDPLGFAEGCNPAMPASLCDTPQLGYLIAGITLGFVGGVFMLVTTLGALMARREAAFLQRARPATARLRSVHQPANAQVNNQPLLVLELEVVPTDGSAYDITLRTRVSPLMMSQVRLVPGVELAVLVDPTSPDRVRIDWAAAARAQETDASSRGGSSTSQ